MMIPGTVEIKGLLWDLLVSKNYRKAINVTRCSVDRWLRLFLFTVLHFHI